MSINVRASSNRSPLADFADLVNTAQGLTNLATGIATPIKAAVDEAALKDPNSDESKAARNTYSQVTGSPIADTVSALQLQQNYGPAAAYAMSQFKQAGEQKSKLAEIAAKGAQDRQTALATAGPETPKPDQFKVATFGKRLQQAEGVFQDLANQGFDPTGPMAGAERATLFGFGIPERAKSAEVKQQEQAERNFVNAVLRRESGSAISPQEFESAAKQYFPRPGDPPEVLQQKAKNRALVINGFQAEAGPAWDKIAIPQEDIAGVVPRGKGANGSLIPGAYAKDPGKVRVIDGKVYVDDGKGFRRL